MAKKDFKQNNPALAFITVPEEQTQEPAPTTLGQKIEPAPEGYKVNPIYVECKTKRVQLVLQPSVVEAMKELAKEKGLSMNEAFNEAVQAYLQAEKKN